MTVENADEIIRRVDTVFRDLASTSDPNAVACEFIAKGLSGIFGIEMPTARENVGILLKGLTSAIDEQIEACRRRRH